MAEIALAHTRILGTPDVLKALADFPFNGGARPHPDQPTGIEIAAQTPPGRVVTPQDIAAAVLFFASPWARTATGQNLVVSGGGRVVRRMTIALATPVVTVVHSAWMT